MKIGLVCPYSFERNGGVQNHVLGLADWLTQRGHDVRVAGPDGRGTVTDLGAGTGIRFNGSLARICLDPRLPGRLRAWARGLDVLHLHEPLVPFVGPLATRLDLPLVATFHAATSPPVRAALRPFAGLLRRTHPIAVSEVAAMAPRAWGLNPVIIGNGIDVGAFGPPARTSQPRIIFVGRFDEPRKGFRYFADALPSIRAACPDVRVVVIGPGRGRADAEFLGAVDDAERNRQLAASDVFVAPNVGGESFGMVLIEALASGADVVASDLPAFRALLSDQKGPVARFVPPGDASALASALVGALRDGPIADAERRAAVVARYDWNQIGRAVEAVYKTATDIA